MNNPILLTTLGIVAVTTIGFAIYFKNKYKRPTDYRALFVVGVALISVGASDNNALIPVGIIFMLVGLKNRSQWQANRFRWSDLSSEEKKVKITFLSIALVACLGTLTYLLL